MHCNIDILAIAVFFIAMINYYYYKVLFCLTFYKIVFCVCVNII